MMLKNWKKGFTLTELMVAMAILGVIAALTVPGIKRDYTKKQFQVAISKFYTDLMQVGPIAQVETGKVNLKNVSDFTDNNWVNKYLSGTLKGDGLKTVASNSAKHDGFSTAYGTINAPGTRSSISNYCKKANGGKTYVLDNGYAVCSLPVDEDGFVTVYVDTNGNKAPNIAGLDLFSFKINLNDDEDGSVTGTTGSCIDSVTADGCFNLVMNNKFKIPYYN